MENASKALLMAGSILIALLVLGALMLMFNQLSSYQKTSSDYVEVTQLSQFNDQFAQYARNDLVGTDLISLVNKVIDYNQKNSGAGEINYNQKITLSINLAPTGKTSFAQKYGVNTFNSNKYEIKDNSTYQNNAFIKVIDTMRGLETEYGRNTMGQLSSNYEALKYYYKGTTEEKEQYGKSVKDIVGKDITEIEESIKNENPNLIEKYREYSEFKTSTFQSSSAPIYINGQIKSMSFEFVK